MMRRESIAIRIWRVHGFGGVMETIRGRGQSSMHLAIILGAIALAIPSSANGVRDSDLFRYRRPSSLITSVEHHRKESLLHSMRGGSTEEEDTITVVTNVDVAFNLEEVEEVLSSEDGGVINEESEDDTSSSAALSPCNLTFSATKPHDGSISDPDGIPTRFLLMTKNDHAEVKAAFESTLSWRKEYNVDTILSRPHTKYDICKAILPHYFSGRDSHGNIVLVQRPATLDFKIMKNNDATIDDLLLHYIYVMEYCWNIIEPGPDGTGLMLNVLDMRGMTFSIMKNQDYAGFGKRFIQMMSENYPGRSYKTLVINSPTWFHALYKIFKPVLRESTRRKIVILKAGEQQNGALRFYFGDSLPKALISSGEDGGMGEEIPTPGTRYFIPIEDIEECEPGPNSLLEHNMRQFCVEQLILHNATMQQVI